jgi:aldose 1-epimerase
MQTRHAFLHLLKIAFLVTLASTAHGQQQEPPGQKAIAAKSIKSEPFGRSNVKLHTLTNANNLKMTVADYGATVVSLEVPDRHGRMADIVLGFNTLPEYQKDSPYFGCAIGRVGNRIADAKFTLDGKTYQLVANNTSGDRPYTLHGGKVGFDKVVWDAEPVSEPGRQGIKFHYLSPDGEEGYPGNLDVTMWYWLTDANDFQIEYLAKTDKPTPVGLTHHSYFNLKGEGEGDILDHELTIKASRITQIDSSMIPTGELRPVKNTPLDFTTPHQIGERIGHDDDQLRFGGGYDHNWVLDDHQSKPTLAAIVYEPKSGRMMEVLTTEPGIQFYGGNFLDGKLIGKSGKPYVYRGGFCLETQHFPDSPNQPTFPSIILKPGETLRSTTIYRFSTK